MARRERPAGGQYRFPLWLAKMSRSRSVRATVGSLAAKLGVATHTTPARARRDVLPTFVQLFREQEDLRVRAAALLSLEPREVAFLLDSEEDSKAVKDIIAAVGDFRQPPGVRPFAGFEEE